MMQTKTTVTRKMTVPAAKVWDAIAKFGRLDVWFPTISTCVVEGSGVGAVRRMDSTRGGKIVDQIVDIQPEKMRLIYERVQSPFAVTSYRGTVEVFESECELRHDDEPGFWESLGYHNYGDPWLEQRYWGD